MVMALFWIVAGIVYVLYKVGYEGFDKNAAGGILVVFIPIIIAVILGGSCWLFVTIFPDYGGMIFGICFLALLISLRVKGIKEEKALKRESTEAAAYMAIRKKLPEPTRVQIQRFKSDIRQHADNPSAAQAHVLEEIKKPNNENLDSNIIWMFKNMQAYWIYCYKENNTPLDKEYYFGDQDLSKKTFFDPAINWDECVM